MALPVTPVSSLWRDLRDEVRRQYRGGRVILGVDGVDGAGKTVFADGLAQVFAEDGSTVFRSSIDGFHRPRSERYARGRKSPEGFYRDSYDYATFRRVLIDPFREGWQTAATIGFQLEAFDVARDAAVESAWVAAPRDAVLIVDGIFLHRPQLRGSGTGRSGSMCRSRSRMPGWRCAMAATPTRTPPRTPATVRARSCT